MSVSGRVCSGRQTPSAFAVIAPALLAVVHPATLWAQCADGTPPPCNVTVPRPTLEIRIAPPPADVRARSFMLLPFRNVRAGPEDDWLVEGSPAMLADALGRWHDVSVVSEERLYPALTRRGVEPGAVMDEDELRGLAEETGGWTAVTGQVMRVGNTVRVTARAYDVVANRVVLRVTEEADSEDDIPGTYERIASRLLATAGVQSGDAALGAATTESLDALKAYLRGLRHYSRAEMRQATSTFQEAVRLDSTFAQAYLKLAQASLLFIDMGSLGDPTHPGYAYLGRAVALSDRLPPRQQRFLHAMDALYHAQFASARRELEELVTTDSADVDALLALARLESLDGVVVSGNGDPRIRGSLHRSNALAKRALLLNPSRYDGYMVLVRNYMIAGGWDLGLVPAARREATSIPAYIRSLIASNLPFIAVLRDTLEVIPFDMRVFLEDGYRTERAGARAVARTWVERWLAVTPSVAEAHLWAARVFELDEEYDHALSELDVADSLGVETGLENLTARRMVLLAESGRRAEASLLADSLQAAGALVSDRFLDTFMLEYQGAALGLHLAAADWAKASTLVQPTNLVERTLLCGIMIPKPLRVDAVRRISIDVREYPDSPEMENCAVATIVTAAAEAGAANLSAFTGQILDAADSLLSSTDRISLALEFASIVNDFDSTRTTYLRALATYKRITELDPDNMDALYQVGRMALFAETELDLAVRSFQQYLEHERQPGAPSHAAAHWRLGMVYELQGKLDDARASYEAALRLDPTFERAREALDALGPDH